MKKISLGVSYILLSLAVLTACSFSNKDSNHDTESKNIEVVKAEDSTPTTKTSDTEVETSEAAITDSEHTSDTIESSDTSVDTTVSENKNDNDKNQTVAPMVKDFVKKLLTYDSIDKRNQSLREYLTEKAIQENSIDVKTNAEFTSKGESEGIYQSAETKDEYLVIATEESRGMKQKDLITLRLKQENEGYKIDGFSIEYIGQS
ncbi:TPA: EF0163 family protein [Enterococcus faecium]